MEKDRTVCKRCFCCVYCYCFCVLMFNTPHIYRLSCLQIFNDNVHILVCGTFCIGKRGKNDCCTCVTGTLTYGTLLRRPGILLKCLLMLKSKQRQRKSYEDESD